MLDQLGRSVRAALGLLAAWGSDDPLEPLRSRARGFADQLSTMAAGFLQWSAEARESFMREVREVVRTQIEQMGVATREDVEALRRRVDALERGRAPAPTGAAGSRRPRAGAATKAPTRKRPATKAPTRKAPTKRSGDRRSPSG